MPDAVQARRMDRMYRYTRHVYDWSRRYYLFGRDRVLRDLARRPPLRVLEVGCGTARNLIRLHRQAPQHRLYGLDASAEMLDTAAQSARQAGCRRALTLRPGLAGDLGPDGLLGEAGPFDVVLCSYVLSMIPSWRAAVTAIRSVLRPGGELHIVDFWDQRGLPRVAADGLQRWLALFGVHHRPALLDHLRALDDAGHGSLRLQPVGPRYAYWATLTRSPSTIVGDGTRASGASSPSVRQSSVPAVAGDSNGLVASR